LERELIDCLTRYTEKQFQAMAGRLDRTNWRLDEIFARVDRLKARSFPRLGSSGARCEPGSLLPYRPG